jgi:hypothetical protein
MWVIEEEARSLQSGSAVAITGTSALAAMAAARYRVVHQGPE